MKERRIRQDNRIGKREGKEGKGTMEDERTIEDKSTPKRERRFINHMELRAGEGESREVYGYAAVFESETELWPGFSEIIRAGAFKRTIDNGADVRALINHDPNLVLARTKSKTLDVFEDEKGLGYRFDAPGTSYGDDLLVSLRRGDIDQSSFAFEVVKEEFETRDDGSVLRTIVEAKLFDVSPVTYPAYDDTEVMARVAFRNMDSHEDTKTQREEDADTKGTAETHADSSGPGSHLAAMQRKQRTMELMVRAG